MRFTYYGADEASLWSWVTMPGTDFAVEIKHLCADEVDELIRAEQQASRVKRELIAKKFFRDFKNATDAANAPIPNSEVNRAAMLDNWPVLAFLTTSLMKAAQERAEGNAGGGSVS